MQGHPEAPARIAAIRDWLENPPYPELQWLNAAPASEAALLRVHEEALLLGLQAECQLGLHEFEYAPSYVGKSSYQSALKAAGAVLTVSRKILDQGQGRGFAIVRPPGHHAERDISMGFCLINNIAVAAADALAQGLRRVAIVDFDAHHGNGTEMIFWDAPQVGYFSSHEAGIYPGTGHLQEAPHARGRIVNAPLPHYTGGAALEKLYTDIVEPWLKAFQPEMLFVSAGYDAHFADTLTSLTVDTSSFYRISSKLVKWADQYCQGRVLFTLEGGYDPLALEDNIQASRAALCDHQDYDDRLGKTPARLKPQWPELTSVIESLSKLHRL